MIGKQRSAEKTKGVWSCAGLKSKKQQMAAEQAVTPLCMLLEKLLYISLVATKSVLYTAEGWSCVP